MKTIYKWALSLGSTMLHMPTGAEVLTVQVQGYTPQLWALIDPEQPNELRTFVIYGSGCPMPTNPGNYVATIQTDGGSLVWHVFDATSTT